MPSLFLPAATSLVLVPARRRIRLTRVAATSATATASVTPFAVEDYLIANCHLTPSQAAKASKSLAHLKSASDADAVLAFLADLGLSSEEVAAVVAFNPHVLSARINSTLAPIFADLRALGLSPSQIALLAQIHGRHFLCRSFVSMVQFWLPIFRSPERLLRFCTRNPWLLTHDPDKFIKPNVAFLKEQCGLSPGDVAKLLITVPRLVTMRPEYVQDAVRRAEQLGVAPGSKMFRHALSITGCVRQETIDAKVAVLRKTLGWSQEEMSLAISKAPRILNASTERLRRTAEFLLNEVGLTPQYIAQVSVLLTLSLERLVPRHVVLKALKEKGLVDQYGSFFTVVAMTDEKFLEKFVTPYEESIPGLTDAYESSQRDFNNDSTARRNL